MADDAPLVIGVGNPLCGDDAAGILVAERLRGRARVIEQGGGASALVEALRGASAAFVVDAARGPRPGRVHRLDAAARPLPQGLFSCSTHGFGVAEGVELARALGALPARCVVYAIEGERFTVGASPSAAVMRAVSIVVARLARELTGGTRCEPSSESSGRAS